MQVRGGCGATAAVSSLTVRLSHSALRQSTLRPLSSFGAQCILAETPTCVTLFLAHVEKLWYRWGNRGQIEPPFGYSAPVPAPKIRYRELHFGFTEYTHSESLLPIIGTTKTSQSGPRCPIKIREVVNLALNCVVSNCVAKFPSPGFRPAFRLLSSPL